MSELLMVAGIGVAFFAPIGLALLGDFIGAPPKRKR